PRTDMTHPTTQELNLLLNETLPAEEAPAVAAHVNGCDQCLEELERLQRKAGPDVRLLASLLLSPPELASAAHDTMEHRSAGAGKTPAQEQCDASWPCLPGYQILAMASSGGMGEIYQARHLSTGRIVAVKMLAANYAHDAGRSQEVLARFRTEVEAASRLGHPNIVAIYDVGVQDC